jgi:hypothetical protein
MQTLATTLYPFVPSGPQFERSLEFFAALGFEQIWQHDGLAGLRCGGAYFLLQDIDVPEWQANQMLTFEVTELVLVALPCRVESRSIPDDFRHVTATLLPESL